MKSMFGGMSIISIRTGSSVSNTLRTAIFEWYKGIRGP